MLVESKHAVFSGGPARIEAVGEAARTVHVAATTASNHPAVPVSVHETTCWFSLGRSDAMRDPHDGAESPDRATGSPDMPHVSFP